MLRLLKLWINYRASFWIGIRTGQIPVFPFIPAQDLLGVKQFL